MRKFYFIFVMLISGFLCAQEPRDPFYGNYTVGNSAELVTLWPQKGGTDCHLKIYDFTDSKTITASRDVAYTGDLALGGQKQMDLACGDFNSDGYDDIVAVWEGANNSLKLLIPQIVPNTLWWSQSHQISFADNTIYGQPAALSPSTIRVIKGQFDHDSDDEFLLAYWRADQQICLTVYNTDEELNPTAAGSIADAKLDATLDADAVYDIACGDFNRDGIDEVLLARNIQNNKGREVVLSVYSYNPSSLQFTRQLSDTSIFATNVHLRHIDLACGDFNNDGIDEAALTFMRWSYRWPDCYLEWFTWYHDFYVTDCHMLYTLRVNPNLKSLTLQQDEPVVPYCSEVRLLDHVNCDNSTVYYVSPPTALTCADLNNDGKDELLYACAKKVRIYQPGIDPALQDPVEITISDRNNDVSRRTIAVADLDAKVEANTGWLPEIIVSDWVTNEQRRLRVFEPDITNGNLTGVHQIPNNSTQFPDEFSLDGCAALTVGNFDGDGVKLGTPTHFRKTIVQPITTINAPPLHYDIFNDEVYDITGCFSGSCNFWAKYDKEISENIQIQTELRSDWGVSTTIGGGFSAMGFAINAHLSASYGQGFSKTHFKDSTITVQTGTEVTFDDVIYSAVNNYDIWEYPIYANGGLVPDEHVLAIVPSIYQNSKQWYNSKSKGDLGKKYIPNHEVGNILSYYPGGNLSAIEGLGQMIYDDDSFNLASSSPYWSVSFANFTGGIDLSHYNVAMEVGTSISGYGMQVGVSGNYSQQGLITATSSVYQGINFFVQMDKVASQATYTVRPFLYWAKNGALVLDYAVTPDTLPGEKTWWQERYGNHPDLSLILPWRYDYEKGFNLTDDDRYRTRDIVFEPDICHPGDTVTVSAVIHNFSLKKTDSPVEVRFYIGDPDDNGITMTSISGDSIFTINSDLLAREKATVESKWKIPDNSPAYPKIYALIDPTNTITEVHENNNKGFRILEVVGETGIKNIATVTPPMKYSLKQNYPNPFNPVTHIEFDIPENCRVILEIYNLLGQKLNTILDSKLAAGSYKIDFNADQLASGLYFYRISTGKFTAVKKMMLVK
jgi:hypothetical protein